MFNNNMSYIILLNTITHYRFFSKSTFSKLYTVPHLVQSTLDEPISAQSLP
jgi:hypothetical protein